MVKAGKNTVKLGAAPISPYIATLPELHVPNPKCAWHSRQSRHALTREGALSPRDRIVGPRRILVTLVLREKEFRVKAGSTLLAALEKADILPESVIATREGEMILEDEILHDGEVGKLIAVISGG